MCTDFVSVASHEDCRNEKKLKNEQIICVYIVQLWAVKKN